MASLDVEKRAVFAAKEDTARQPPREALPRRRIVPWLALFLGVLATLSFGATSHRCSAKTSFLSGSYIGSPAIHAHPRLGSQSVTSRSPTAQADETKSVTTSAAAPTRTVLKTFEVAQPVLMPDGPAESDGSTRHGKDYSPELCSVLLMRHDFAWSYNAPFVGSYTPPDCEFNRIVLNFSVVSQGRQFDRLAIMYFGDTEVWRTSTAEPIAPPGISWIYLKDVTEYMYFWKSPQKIIFDLGNLIDDKYTGVFNTTMTAIFYNTDVVTDQAPPSDLIIPISARRGANNEVSRFMLPAEHATNTIGLPRNIRRAVFSVLANGQAGEEFWWSNVLQSDIYTFNATAGELPGLSPFREIQILIDGQLAGVEWPFPVIFTGGVAPSLHRPIVGIHAFDLREHEIDVTPFLPLLCDGKEHTFTIRVAGLNSTGDDDDDTPATLTDSVHENWFVTGKLFLWLDDDPSSITTGDPPTIVNPPPTILLTRSLTTNGTNGTNETLTYTTSVERTLQITAGNLRTQRDSSSPRAATLATWSQSLRYTNKGHITAFGHAQVNDLLISGNDTASSSSSSSSPFSSPYPSSLTPNVKGSTPPVYYYCAAYAYPLFCNSSYAVGGGNLSISARLRQGKRVVVEGPGVFASGLEAFSPLNPGLVGGGGGGRNGGPDGGGDGQEGRSNGWREICRGRGRGLASILETSKEGTAELRQSGDGRESIGWGEARQVFWFGVGAGAGAGVIRADDEGMGRDSEELYYREVAAVNGTVVEDLRRMRGRRVEGGGLGGGGGKIEGVIMDAAALVYA
ncbi:hypothetical protein N658DRAFT_557165 [Parathielavia hyrcaniae]|uniref:Peptide N-acetyl-beta-D-glucosaminyl asparaginase amidase A N-terminal domain-containing protein n=1 Tax=Parathielavia hyrcaniae TaxID=113614 RepID=A0AAN6Q9K2_9PEZI|nr:hypothetical protein N658DRAFT_557165 [Parathielavia hyrcaniae]